jgi:uncharacterized membrane protein YkgB
MSLVNRRNIMESFTQRLSLGLLLFIIAVMLLFGSVGEGDLSAWGVVLVVVISACTMTFIMVEPNE